MIAKGYNSTRFIIEYQYSILSQMISEIDHYYQDDLTKFKNEALDCAKQNSDGDIDIYFTILNSFNGEVERKEMLCQEARKILFCSIFSYYERCLNSIVNYYNIETKAQQVTQLYKIIYDSYIQKYSSDDFNINKSNLEYVNEFCRLLRNYFMHGELSNISSQMKLNDYVNKHNGVKLFGDNIIEIVSDVFLLDSLNNMKTILDKIENAFSEKNK